jgi:TIR domain/Putative nucleic acid-binding region
MTQVFTSYSRRDKETVDQIVGVIENTGIDVWIDREDIKAGDMWRVQIVEAIDTCAAFLLMLSPNSAASDNVRKEIDLAEGSERPIFAVMLQPVKLPADIRYQLAGLQLIDVQKVGFDNAVARLIEDLKEHIKKMAAAAEQSIRQVELVIQGIDISAFGPEKQEQLLAFISSLANTDRSQIKIENVAAGSLHVFIAVPSATAYQLKTLALNRDPRFKEMGIASLRLDGDKKFINVSLGKPVLTATLSPLAALWLKIPALFSPVLGATAGKALTVLLITTVLAGAGILVPATFAPAPTAAQTPTSMPTSLPTWTSTLASTETSAPTATQTPSPTSTITETPTATQTAPQTSTVTPTPVPTYLTLTGVIANPLSNLVACRYGPGDIYLYRFGPQNGIQINISGKVEIRTQRETQTWLWGLLDGYSDPCWVNARYVRLNGDVSSLETVYPEKVDLPVLPESSWRWPAPQNVKAFRQGDQINIYWDFYDVPLGERESESSPRYVLELWLCQSGQVAFTPRGAMESSLQVIDQAGCAEPSHGRIYLAEKHGYIGPVEIPWPSYATPTP